MQRLTTLRSHLTGTSSRALSTSTPAMAQKLDINSSFRLRSGYDIPILGYGVYQTPAAECEEVCSHALKTGYRHIDSATAYRNEAPSAAAMHASMKSTGIPRSALFFTSKVPPRDVNYKGAATSVDETLKKTKLDYIDLYLLHAPYGGKEGRLGAWKALVEAVEAGKVRSIGVSNYGVHHLEELEQYIKEVEEKEGKGKGGVLSVNQVELHPWLARPDIVEWCEKRGVLLEAYSPLVRGDRAGEQVLDTLGRKYNKTWAQILLRWSLQKGFSPLPKSVTKSRIEDNADLFDFELSADDMNSLHTGAYAPCAWDPTTSKD